MSATLPEPIPARDDQDLSALAQEWGLTPSAQRQSLGPYIRELWVRRDFIIALGTGRKSVAYGNTSLGRTWLVLSPILNAIVYYFIFGVLLKTSKGVENFPAFLIVGVFMFTYTARVVSGGAKSIANNRAMISAIHFPRAAMPLAVIVQEFQQQIVAMGVLGIIVLLTGEPLTWMWLGVIPALLLQTVFNTGLCLLVARWTAASQDVAQILPFAVHMWRYLSGVMFSIPVFTEDLAPWVEQALYLNPLTEYIQLARASLMDSQEVPAYLWGLATFWAVFFLVLGFVVFHRAEESYSRG